MQVTVTDNKMETITYGYSPEHYAGVVEFYSDLVQSGGIYTYTVKMQCCRLDLPAEMWDQKMNNLFLFIFVFIGVSP